MNPEEDQERAIDAPARSLGRGARGRGRTLPASSFSASRVAAAARDDDTVSEAGTIDQFLREEGAAAIDSMSLAGTTISDETSLGGRADEAYPPSVSDFQSRGTGPSSTGTRSITGSDVSSRLRAAVPVVTLPQGFDKTGTYGIAVNLQTNYYRMNETAGFKLYQYQVDFVPIEDDTSIKKKLLRQHEKELGAYIFDGSMMRKTNIIPKEQATLFSSYNDTKYTITIRMVGEIGPEDNNYLQFFNIVQRKISEVMGMEELGRNFYDPDAAIEFPESKLTLWPGFQTAIRNHESGILLCVEVTHKVLRTASVYETCLDIGKTVRNKIDLEQQIRAMFVDSIVITHYNRRTYKISDIDFKITPASTFRGQDGTVQTYAEYYKKRYGITIEEDEMTQPMLISLPRKKDLNKGITGNIYLCSSLCHPTGLTDEMRKDFNLMKSLSKHLHMNPDTRKATLENYMKRLLEHPGVKEEFCKWGINFNPIPVQTLGRVLPRENILTGAENPVEVDAKGDWGRALGRGRHMRVPVDIKKWIVFTPPQERDIDRAKHFVKVMKNIGQELGANVAQPLDIIAYNIVSVNERTIYELVKKYLKDDVPLDLVFFILPNNQLKRYAEVKHYFTLKLGIPTQCCLSKTLGNSNLNAIASKIILQVTAKLGGVPWMIKVPLKKLMVVGFDVYHCSDRKGESAGALVSTLDPLLSRYSSVVSFHKDKSELSSKLCMDMTENLMNFLKFNGFLPDRIVFFRDGVGEGQIAFVLSHEVEQVKLALRDMYSEKGFDLPKLTFIIVTKKINTRAFLMDNGHAHNLQVGTVMDRDITLPERYDFFMVSQDVRQGTVSPSNYNVVYDESGWPADRIQQLSFKMTHLYFNWSGTVAVPAMCQYAHKLAYLTGVALNDQAHKRLQNNLWYL